jgi:hypothetical protein
MTEIETSRRLRSQSNNDGSCVGEGNLPNHGGPASERRTLEAKEEKDAAKEAKSGTAFAQFLPRSGGRQTGAVLLPLGVEGG